MTNKHSHPDRQARLRAMLLEDTGSAEEADRLLDTVNRLDSRADPAPTSADTARLIAALQPLVEQTAPPVQRAAFRQRLQSSLPWLLLRAQLKVVRGEIWLASLFVMVLGTVVTLLTYSPAVPESTLPIVLIAPVVTALGMSFLYGAEVDPAIEILLTTPVSPRLVLLARLALVFGFDLALGLLGSAILAVSRAQISLWPLVMAWLAPMSFLSALAFLLSVLSADAWAGGLTSLVLWILHSVVLFIHNHGAVTLAWLAYIPDLTRVSAAPWLLTAAVLMGGLGLWLVGREERWIRRTPLA